MSLELIGKRYIELEETISVSNNSLFSVYRIGQPENNKIEFLSLQRNISLANLKDLTGKTLVSGGVLKYVSGEFNVSVLQESDLPSISISKVTNLSGQLSSKENSFQKGNVRSSTLTIQNGNGRLYGSQNLEIEVNLTAIQANLVPRTRSLRFRSANNSVSINGTYDETFTLEQNIEINLQAQAVSFAAGSGINLSDNTISVDATVLRTNSLDQIKTGPIRIRLGTAGQERMAFAWEYPDNSGEDYHLRLYSNGEGNNVRWYYRQKSVLGINSVRLDFPVLGFKNSITIIGADNYPTPDLEIEDFYNVQENPTPRHPLRLYVAGQSQFKEAIVVGTTLKKTQAFGPDTTIYNEGSIVLGTGGSNTYRTISLNTPNVNNAYIGMPNYSAFNIYNSRVSNGHYFKSGGLDLLSITGSGIATVVPGGSPGALGQYVRFGSLSIDTNNTVNRLLRISVGNIQVDLLGRVV